MYVHVHAYADVFNVQLLPETAMYSVCVPCSLARITDISLEGCEDCGVTTASREQSMP